MLLLPTTHQANAQDAKQLTPEIQRLTDEAFHYYSTRQTEQFGDDRLQALLQQDLGDARQTSETIHRAVEEFVGDADPSDDLTKLCIKMK